MHILVIDGGHVEAEFRAKFGPGHEYTFLDSVLAEATNSAEQRMSGALATADVAFNFGTSPAPGTLIRKPVVLPLFEEASAQSIVHSGLLRGFDVFGFCGLPTLFNRPLLELSCYDPADSDDLASICAALGTDYRVVEDRVGLVTPRVICMIINEACYTLQEGTASIQDIDLSMKLGTGYPRGPFEWANAIGVPRVYAVLEALWNDTHDERYKICPLLKRQALRGEPFAGV